jgi:hypothetical protein
MWYGHMDRREKKTRTLEHFIKGRQLLDILEKAETQFSTMELNNITFL